MFCRKCGKELVEGAKFCAGCGTEVTIVDYAESIKDSSENTIVENKIEPVTGTTEKTTETIAEITEVVTDEKVVKEKKIEKKDKRPMGKKLIIIIVAVVAVLGIAALIALSGTMKKKPISESVNIEEPKEKPEQTTEEEGKEPEVVEETVDDPLADYTEVDFIGDKGRDDQSTRKLVAKLIDEESVDPGKILSVCCCDFDGDDEYAAFVFVGQFNGSDDEEYAEEYYEGNCYYVSEDMITKLEQPQSDIWHDTGSMVDCGHRQFFFINEHYTTGLNTQVWSVKDGRPAEEEISRCGQIYEIADGGYGVVDSIYDLMYDREMQGMLGHTWKQYYCDYDESKDAFVEYCGVEVDLKDVEELCGRDIINELYEQELYVLNAYVRGNDILNINYLNPGDADVTFGNVSFNLKDGSMIRANDYGDGELEEANYGGIYLDAITGAEKVMPKNVPAVEATETDIVVYTLGNLIDMGGYQILYGIVEDYDAEEYLPRAFIIDGDTILDDGLGIDSSAMEWMTYLANPTEEMTLYGDYLMGVFGMTTTGSHVDSVNGQYWWD